MGMENFFLSVLKTTKDPTKWIYKDEIFQFYKGYEILNLKIVIFNYRVSFYVFS